MTDSLAQPIRVLHLNAGACGGAALGAVGLHESLLDLGVTSTFLYGNGPRECTISSAERMIQSQILSAGIEKVLPRFETGLVRILSGRRGLPFSLGQVGNPLFQRRALLQNSDIIHLHWVNGSMLSLRQIAAFNKPVVWTLRDEWPYTGGCHYTGECQKFEMECGQCPMLNSHRLYDLSTFIQRQKTRLPEDIRYVGISDWITRRAKRSSLLRTATVTTILNSINPSFFESDGSTERGELRRRLQLPEKATILLAGALDLDSPFKGYEILQHIKPDARRDLHLLTFGSISDDLKDSISIPATHLGPVPQQMELKEVYRAADLFLAPSHQESFGKTLAEAAACGLPTVCYDVGGPAEIVIHEQTGFKAEPFNTDQVIAYCMQLVDDVGLRTRIGHDARRLSVRFKPARAAKEYLQLYREVLNR